MLPALLLIAFFPIIFFSFLAQLGFEPTTETSRIVRNQAPRPRSKGEKKCTVNSDSTTGGTQRNKRLSCFPLFRSHPKQINSKAPSPRLLHASYPQMETPSSISVTAKNEYGRYERASLALYGLEMVVEPHRETTLEVVGAASPRESLFRWRVDEIDDAGAPLAGADPELDAWGGAETTVTLTKAGGVFLLKVQEQENRPGGALLSEGTVKVSCRYVRREIRDLTENDREEFLEALEVYYTVGTEEGRAKYGDDFFDYRRLALFHNAPVSSDYLPHLFRFRGFCF